VILFDPIFQGLAVALMAGEIASLALQPRHSPDRLLYGQSTLGPKRGELSMTVDRYLRRIAGFFVMLSVALAVTVDIRWLYFTGFRRTELVSVVVHELVPDDHLF